jgi:hypothetical protein
VATNRSERPLIHPKRADHIRSLAETIADEHSPSTGTDLNGILADSSIDLVFDDFPESFDGLLIKDKRGFRIVCNRTTGNRPKSARCRFTIAHEVGHYFIDEHRVELENRPMPSMGERAIEDNLIEREADLFASHLLLPSKVVQKACKATKGLDGIRQMAARYQVSVKCSAIRYVGEDIVPCCIIFRDWERQLKWKWFSRKAWLAGMRKLREGCIDKGATDQTLKRGPDATSEAILTSGCLARNVFQMGDGLNSNEIFQEEAIALGEFGVLTLLTSAKHKLPFIADLLDQAFSRPDWVTRITR